MKKSDLEKQFKVAKKSLQPSCEVFHTLSEMYNLMQSFYEYLEEKHMSTKVKKNENL